jgi:threonine/homoserine/homoserine lactone efflux protein
MPPAVTALIVSLLPFVIVMSFTPGPNNLMLANAGARFGFLRTLPHQAGVVLGFSFMTLGVGLGIAGLIAAAPKLYMVLKYASIAYLLYLAWKIATSESAKPGATPQKPMTFLQAAAFQWVNPKGWVMALGAVTTYTTLALDMRFQVMVIATVFAVIGVAAGTTWVVFGQVIRRYLTTPRKRMAFNWTMAALLVLSVAPVVVEH